MSLAQNLLDFRYSIIEANQYIYIAHQTDAAGNYFFAVNFREFVSEKSFQKIFMAWEQFVEKSFVKYLLGELSILGTVITKHSSPINEEHCQRMLIGTQKYVDWANPEIIIRLSNIYFDVINPFHNNIGALRSDLFDLKTIRNACAHLSSTSAQQLDALASRKLNAPQINVTAYQLLFSQDPGIAGQTILASYLHQLDATAENIANGT